MQRKNYEFTLGNSMYKKKVHLHFVGIGGIGMSGIAKILYYQGYIISGCDNDIEQQTIYDLKTLGCSIHHGNNTPSCHDELIDIVVYSSAIQMQNPEIIAAQQRGIPTIPRALMLAELMRTKYSVAISGSHGKTTTTSLISHILIEAQKDPTVIIGGRLKTISTNAHFGLGDFLVAEADESDRSLTYLQATLAVVTNINLEHLDTYNDIEDIKETFKQFLHNLPFYGTAIVCTDNEHVRSILPITHCKMIKYSFDTADDLYAKNVVIDVDHSLFDVYYKHHCIGSVRINMPGRHNVLNALAAIAVAYELEISFDIIKQALESFKGVERRFSFNGLYKGAEIFDDYGHHPEEIKNTVEVAARRKRKRLTLIFEPHRYSRTYKLWDVFLQIFKSLPIDTLVVTDIYAASEAPIENVTAQRFTQELKKLNPAYALQYISCHNDFKEIKQYLDETVEPDDLVLLQGAGKINKLISKLR
jgi:UDP-N-acetylmuramate--alanine ligase